MERELDEQVSHPADADGPESEAARENRLDNCVICQCEKFRTENLLALPCGHTLHDACIRKCWTYSNKPIGWCPNKCTEVLPNVLLRDEERALEEAEASARSSIDFEFVPWAFGDCI